MSRQQQRRRTIWLWRTLMVGIALTGNVGAAMCVYAIVGIGTAGRVM